MRLAFLLVAALMLMAQATANAHFVWVAVEKDSGGQPLVNVWFSELAEPDSAELLDRITKVKVWTRTAKGPGSEVALTKKIDNSGGGALVGAAPQGTNALAAYINYGVLTRGQQSFLLQYYAKYLDASASDLQSLAREEKLDFDIVPTISGGKATLEVSFRGKPAKEAEVIVLDPTAEETKTATDANGQVTLKGLKPGLYSIRAKWVVVEAGKDGDKEYPQVNHYSTLALRVPQSQVGSASRPAGSSASDLLNAARQSRVVWHNFPGFEADLTLFTEGRR